MATAPLSRVYVKVFIAHHGDPPYVCEHCGELVVQLTGRTKGCGVVHHKDENRQNNDISNLAAMHRECHVSHHNKDKPRRPMTEDERQAHSERLKKRFADPDVKEKLSKIRRGKPWSEARRAAFEAQKAAGVLKTTKGYKHTEETKARMRSAAQNRRRSGVDEQ